MLFVLVPPPADVDGEEIDSVGGQPVVPAGAVVGGGNSCLGPLPGVGVWLLCKVGDGVDVLPPPVACQPVPLLLPSLPSQPVPLGSILI